jgi:class 3 adenylate cyclase/tetratricopeptide (TPR) repeat protein
MMSVRARFPDTTRYSMELLESFVAGALLQRVRRAARAGRTGACATFSGAALFADISGYTTLAETLCAQGADGVERLGDLLDVSFRGHVRAVQETGGEIACFAGDALVAYWAADDGDLPAAAQRAQACARMLHASSRGAPSTEVRPPPLHIGVSAGTLWGAHLGGPAKWQLLLAGGAVREACVAAGRASPGETILAPAIEELSRSDRRAADSITRRSSDASPPESKVDLAVLAPRRVQEYAGDGYSAWLPQRREICALFVRIDGLDDAAGDGFDRHQMAIESLHGALSPYTGSSGTLLLDDKGLVFTLCLGMPHDAHADDALRAVRAGLAVRTALGRRGLDSAVGVAAGPGVCMPLGGAPRRHYWAVGRFMHVAARLMEAAGSGLLCTEEVADRVRRAVSLSPERPLTLKGFRWPLQSYRVSDAPMIDAAPVVLHGRDDERARLDECVHAFEQGRGSVIWIAGEAGLGKTALLQYLQREVLRREITCLSGGAGSMEVSEAYASWRPVFAALLEDPALSDRSSQEQRQARLGAIRHGQLASLVNAVVPGFLDETPLVQALAGQARADATVSLLSEVIGSNATPRFVLLLEDCHWMDTASCRLLLRVAQEYPEALIVLTSRPVVDNQELDGLRRLQNFSEMTLPALRTEAIASIVRSVAGEGRVTTERVVEIVSRSRGNPLFAREYALLLTTVGMRSDVEPAPAPPRASFGGALPVTVQSLIASRLDALSPSQDVALKTASVIGDRFGLDLLASVCPGAADGNALADAVAALAGQQLIVRDETDDGWFAFHHALIREVAYQQLTQEQRRTMHRRAAEAIEQRYGSDLYAHAAALAHHWSRAEDPAATIRYGDVAASQALAAGAFEEADRLLRSCVDAADDMGAVAVGDRIRWHRQLADARHGMGQLESRSVAARQALRLAGRTRPHRSIALVAQAGVRLAGMGLRRIGAGRTATGSPSRLLDIARAYRHSAEVCYFNNDMIGMICDSVSAVSCASQLPPSAVLAGASTELGGILSVAGLRRAGETILRRAIALAEAAGDQTAQAYAHMISCLYYVGIGDWSRAESSAQRCQELCEPMDDRVNWTNAEAVRFWMSHYRCHDASAYEAARRLRDRASETGNRQHRAWALRFLGLCALRGGAPREAIAHLQAGLECLGETAALNERIPTLGILSLAQLQNGEVWSARATAREALAQVVRVRRPIGHSTLEGYSALATVSLDAWRDERSPEWRRAIGVCLRVLGRYRRSFPVGEPRYHLHLGDYQRLAGSIRAARRSYRRCESVASSLRMPWESIRCRESLASIDDGPASAGR